MGVWIAMYLPSPELIFFLLIGIPLLILLLLAMLIVFATKSENFKNLLKRRRMLITLLATGIPLLALLFGGLLILYARAETGFRALPEGATNGEWAAQAVAENNRHLRDSHDSFRGIVVRAEVIGERSEVLSFGDSVPTNHLYSFHQLKVIDVYRGSLKVGDVIAIRQIERLESWTNYKRWLQRNAQLSQSQMEYRIVHDTWVPLSVGDDLILFLSRNVYLFEGGTELTSPQYLVSNPIQGVYRYVPSEFRDDCENFAFESVNPHNNLTLTVADLLRFRDFSD
jgi:hypothetical protein